MYLIGAPQAGQVGAEGGSGGGGGAAIVAFGVMKDVPHDVQNVACELKATLQEGQTISLRFSSCFCPAGKVVAVAACVVRFAAIAELMALTHSSFFDHPLPKINECEGFCPKLGLSTRRYPEPILRAVSTLLMSSIGIQ